MTTQTKLANADKILAATAGTQFGAIIRCAMDIERDAVPRFVGTASLTSDGFVICSFIDRHGDGHVGAFVGAEVLWRNVNGLKAHLKMSEPDAQAFEALIKAWSGRRS